MPSSSHRQYSRFIPSEEVGDVVRWKFGAMDGSDEVEPEPEAAAPELPVVLDEAAQQALVQQALDEAFARGLAQGVEQGSAQTALEWQHRLDDYIANQGHEAAQRFQSVFLALDHALSEAQQRMAQDVLHLACAIARQVVRQELSVNPNAVQPVVREAVGMLLTEGRPALVRLNPVDLEALAEPLRAEFSSPGVQWLADAAVPIGGCLVESSGTVLDGSLEKRWQRALAELGLSSVWQEEGPLDGD
ncbi:MAG: flagellar assembly protein FliH [Burkholderiaceae bacterium]|nr:flagellar assembly protein FliH [Burkholderiaceae bacterium]